MQWGADTHRDQISVVSFNVPLPHRVHSMMTCFVIYLPHHYSEMLKKI